MTVWVGSASGNKVLLDPKVGTGTRRDVQVIYVGTATGNKLVYQRIPTMTLTATAAGWDQINLSWPIGGTGISYELLRSGTLIYSGTATSYSDTLRMPGTTYSYTLRTLSGTTVLATSTASRATPLHASMVLTATAVSYNTLALRWTDTDQRSINNYKLYRKTGPTTYTKVDDGADKAHDESGLAEGTAYTYMVSAYRGTTRIPTDSNEATATTSTRPVSSGSVFGPGLGAYSWTECTEKSLAGPAFSLPVACYVTAYNLAVVGYSPEAGRVNPHIDGTYFGVRATDGSLAYPTKHYMGFATGNFARAAGGHSCGALVGGNCDKTQWYAYTGGSYSVNIGMGQVNYWYYSARERDEELRALPWWREELAGRALHIDSWCDHDGRTTAVKVRDKDTDELLAQWAEGD